MYEEWRSGYAKSTLDARWLGIETEKRSSLASENARLRALLAAHGIDPDTEPPAPRPDIRGHSDS